MNHRLAIAIEEQPDGKQTVAEHFGRCSSFIILEIDPQKQIIKRESQFNPFYGQHTGNCQLPGYIQQFDINTIIAGGMGQKAVFNFHNFNIEVITASGLGFDEALSGFLEGKLKGYQECNAHSHDCA
jgi:predicted Fe-Mo cluster-binding NifX family protein